MVSSVSSIQSQNSLLEFSASQKKISADKTTHTNDSESVPSTVTSIEDIRSSNRVSTIDLQEIKELFNQIKQEARHNLDVNNHQNKNLEEYDYLESTIEKIMDYPIEVKIERDELNLAVIYNSMGINLLDVKRIEVRMELLELANDDVTDMAKAGFITKDQKSALNNQISNHMNTLQEQKDNILERKQLKENEALLLGQLKRSRS